MYLADRVVLPVTYASLRSARPQLEGEAVVSATRSSWNSKYCGVSGFHGFGHGSDTRVEHAPSIRVKAFVMSAYLRLASNLKPLAGRERQLAPRMLVVVLNSPGNTS